MNANPICACCCIDEWRSQIQLLKVMEFNFWFSSFYSLLWFYLPILRLIIMHIASAYSGHAISARLNASDDRIMLRECSSVYSLIGPFSLFCLFPHGLRVQLYWVSFVGAVI